MDEITRKYPEHKFYFFCPPNTPSLSNKVIKVPFLSNMSNKYSVRFSFDWHHFKKAIERTKTSFDIVFVNQSEQTPAIYALLHTMGQNPAFFSYFHYLPIDPVYNKYTDTINYDKTLNMGGLGKIIFLRQIESASLCTKSTICSAFGKDLFLENAKKIINDKLSSKINIINPPLSLEELNKARTTDKFSTPTFMYNHRLYAHYGSIKLFKWLKDFYKTRKTNFKVLITNPTAKRSAERDRLNPFVSNFLKKITHLPFVSINYFNNRQDYYRAIWMCDGGLAPIKPGALWSMSVADVMGCSRAVIAPNCACFPEMIGGSDLLYSNKKTFFSIFEYFLDNPSELYKLGKSVEKRAKSFDISIVAKKFMRMFGLK
jgi:hypothetical protein